MAQLAFIVSTQRAAAALDVLSFMDVGQDIARQIKNKLDDPSATLLQVAKSDSRLVAQTYDMITGAAPSNPLTVQTGKYNNLLIAGGAAGNLSVAGIKTNSRLLLVAKVVDAGQAYTDLTSEFTVTAAGVINNTGGTTTASSHVIVVWA